jgi:hypothetical protein
MYDKVKDLVDAATAKRKSRLLLQQEDDFHRLMTPKEQWYSTQLGEPQRGDLKRTLMSRCPGYVSTKVAVEDALSCPPTKDNPFSFDVKQLSIVQQPTVVEGSVWNDRQLIRLNHRLQPPRVGGGGCAGVQAGSYPSPQPKASGPVEVSPSRKADGNRVPGKQQPQAARAGNQGASDAADLERVDSGFPSAAASREPSPDSPRSKRSREAQVQAGTRPPGGDSFAAHSTQTESQSFNGQREQQPATVSQQPQPKRQKGMTRSELLNRFKDKVHCNATNMTSAKDFAHVILFTYDDERVNLQGTCIRSIDISGTVLPPAETLTEERDGYAAMLARPNKKETKGKHSRISTALRILMHIIEGSLDGIVEIETLVADNCQLNDDDAFRISQAIRFAKDFHLTKLSLRNNLFTDVGVDYLKKAVKYRPTIMNIDLNGNKQVENANSALTVLEERLENNRNEIPNMSLIKRIINA